MKRLIEVCLPFNFDKNLSYILPDSYQISDENDLIGYRVIVPLGNKLVTGFVLGKSDYLPNMNYKEIYDILDDYPIFSQKMINFSKWISEYYISPLGEVLKAALPAMMTSESYKTVRLKSEYRDYKIIKNLFAKSSKKREICYSLINSFDFISLKELEQICNFKISTIILNSLIEQGIIESELELSKIIEEKTETIIYTNSNYKNNANIFDLNISKLENKASKQYQFILKFINKLNFKISSINDIESTNFDLNELLSDKNIRIGIRKSEFEKEDWDLAIIKSLEKKGFLTIENIEINKQQHKSTLSKKNELLLSMTEEQKKCTNQIINSLDKNEYDAYLLYGVTGSGKTIVYINAIKHCIDQGKKALILVPEIALTPQLIDRFENVFPGKISVQHSKLGNRDRFENWMDIKKGETQIVIGARSAIFAQLDNLALIIIDEEHDSSYKQDTKTPRYNARDAAIYRAKLENCLVLLGSATPSIETMYNVNLGRFKLLEILNRADGASLPTIVTLNSFDLRKQGQMKGILSKDLLDKIENRIIKKESVIILQNLRGFASFIECKDCGTVEKCPDCDIPLTYHKRDKIQKCHYCGFSKKALRTCPSCGCDEFSDIGYGTQRVEDDIHEYFDELGIELKTDRMDYDTVSGKNAHRNILTNFGNGKTDILIGTQMVAKGIDFERVSLVGVINADMSLNFPDFRAAERTFQLLTQVAGRAGRSGKYKGEVIIQTSNAQHYAIANIINGNYYSFFNHEIEHRKNALFPPFVRFCIVELNHKENSEIDDMIDYFLSLLPKKEASLIIYKPIHPSIPKMRGLFRRIIVVKNIKKLDPSGKILTKYLNNAKIKFREKYSNPDIRLIIDIDSYTSL